MLSEQEPLPAEPVLQSLPQQEHDLSDEPDFVIHTVGPAEPVTPVAARRMPRVRWYLLGIVLGVFLLLVFSASARMFLVRSGLSAIGAAPPVDVQGHTNILLLGTGDQNHDGADLTDTMIIASIDPVTRSAIMLSIPRDLFLDAGRTFISGRVNAVYANEKYRLERTGLSDEEASLQALLHLGEEMSDKLGVPIHGVIKADFTAFVKTVDALGGLDIEVAEKITDYTYPIAEGRTGIFQIEAGPQHVDGETALRYARSRHSTNDFDRSARQQQLLKAIADKTRSLGRIEQIGFITSLYQDLDDHVVTTMTTQELLGIAQIGSSLSLDRMITMQLNFNTGGDFNDAQAGGFVTTAPPELFEGASILLPVALPGGKADWRQIQTLISFLVNHRDAYLNRPVVRIVDGGAKRLQAHRLRNELLRYGWQVAEIESMEEVQEVPTESMLFYRTNDHVETAEFLGTLLSIPAARDTESGSGDVLIMLGSGYMYQPFQTLSGAVLGIEN